MQAQKLNVPAKKRGRPRTSALSPIEQARLRKTRQREKNARNGKVKVELLLSSELKNAVQRLCRGRSLSDVGTEAFLMWLRTHGE